MDAFPSAAHLSAGAGLAPGQHESAGQRQSVRIPPRPRHLRTVLVQGAWSAVRQRPTYLAAQFANRQPRLGKKRAMVAVAHSGLVSLYDMLRNQPPYADRGPIPFAPRRRRADHATGAGATPTSGVSGDAHAPRGLAGPPTPGRGLCAPLYVVLPRGPCPEGLLVSAVGVVQGRDRVGSGSPTASRTRRGTIGVSAPAFGQTLGLRRRQGVGGRQGAPAHRVQQRQQTLNACTVFVAVHGCASVQPRELESQPSLDGRDHKALTMTVSAKSRSAGTASVVEKWPRIRQCRTPRAARRRCGGVRSA